MDHKYIFEEVPISSIGGTTYFEVDFETFALLAWDAVRHLKDDQIAAIAWDADKSEWIRELGSDVTPRMIMDNIDAYTFRRFGFQTSSSGKDFSDNSRVKELSNNANSWSEYFGSILLSHIAFSIYFEKQLMSTNKLAGRDITFWYNDIGEFMGHLVLEGYRLHATLELVHKPIHWTGRFIDPYERAQNSKQAAIARHAPGNKIKNRYIEFYFQNKEKGVFRTKDEAAIKFLDSLNAEDKKIIGNRETLKKALRAFQKAQNPPIPFFVEK